MPDSPEVGSPPCRALNNRLLENGIHCRNLIGVGAYSKVRIAWSDTLKCIVAVKEIDKSSGSDFVKRFLPREVEIVQNLSHPNIVRVFNVIELGPYVCMVEECGSHGDLLKKIKKNKRIEEEEGKFLFRQLVEALIYLQSMEVVHRDLKCENVFFDSFDNVKLGDFGFARYMRPGDESRTFCGSKAYVAPEILRSRTYGGFSVDVWSAGVILYIMVTGLMPYDESNPRRMLEKQLRHRLSFPNRIQLTLAIKRLIFDMVHPAPARRITCPEIVRSAWLADTPYKMNTRSRNFYEEDVTCSSPETSIKKRHPKGYISPP